MSQNPTVSTIARGLDAALPAKNATYSRQLGNPGVTEIVETPNRSHALVIDSGWRDVCDTVPGYVRRFSGWGMSCVEH